MTDAAAAAKPSRPDQVNILLVDDQPAKLLSYETILEGLGENLIKAGSARHAFEHLLKNEVAVILVDVCMPELDGFELASMIRDHPRFQQTAIIFVSAVMADDFDRLRGYEAGAVDYVAVPVVPEVLRAKVKVFAELYRKTRQLERLNEELEQRVADRTAALEASTAQLRASEQRRSLALAAGQMGSWDWDVPSGQVVWDAGQHRIFGIPVQEDGLTFEQVRGFIDEDDLSALERIIAGASAEKNTFQIEMRIRPPAGGTRWCICAGAIALAEDMRPLRISGVTIDITDRKAAEQALHRLNEELEKRIEERTNEREQALAQLFEAQKLDTIGQLTGGVAHDFNNLLMAVLGSLELLRKRMGEDPRNSRLLENAFQAAERGAALTQRLLAFARRQELKPESVDVVRLVNGMEDLLTRALGPGVSVVKNFPDDLSPIRIDANQLELALLNLAVNARDAMPNGGKLTLAADNVTLGRNDEPRNLPTGDYVRICVTDTGTGMDAATLARAAEPFFTTKGPGKGTGLGLSMAHGLAAQSGGALTITSTPGEGTRVILWLPVAEHEAVEEEQRPVHHGVLETHSRTVLVVDDDPLVCTGTAAMLEDLGHVVLEASTGREALHLLGANGGVDLVITDHAMPGMTGMELARHIRVTYPDLPVLLATGYADLPGESDGFALPRLAKPFRQEDLASAIASTGARSSRTATELEDRRSA